VVGWVEVPAVVAAFVVIVDRSVDLDEVTVA